MQLTTQLKWFFILSWNLLLMPIALAQNSTDVLLKVVSISAEEEDVFQILEKLSKQTDIQFVYNPSDLNAQRKYNFEESKQEIKSLLKELFKEEPIDFKANNGQIILFKNLTKKNETTLSKSKSTEKIVFSGYVHDAETGEALIAAAVYEKNSLTATITNNFGFFSLTLPSGEQTVTISYIGHESKEYIISDSKQVKVNLAVSNNNLEEVVVLADPEEKNDPIQSSQMSSIRLSMKMMKAVPASGGEPDILKGIALLPGFAQGADGTSGFYVRGGGADQNLILLDGVPMYNPFHLFGFLSTFNSDAINNVEVTKGAFPARYGGRLSSVLDITTKEGSNQKWIKNITLGLLSARVNVGGPIKKDVSSISFSARRTLLDLIIVPAAALREEGFVKKTGYNFGDVNMKFNYKLSDKSRIFLSGFYTKDVFSLKASEKNESIGKQKLDNSQGWSNYFGSLRWNFLFNDKLFCNTTLYYSNYQFFTRSVNQFETEDPALSPSFYRESDFTSAIDDWSIKQDYQYFANHNHTIRFGANAIFHTFKPGVFTISQETENEMEEANSVDNSIKAKEYSLYLEDDMKLGKKFRFNFGIHAAGINVQETFYGSIQPRASLNFIVNKNFALKAGYSKMNQFLHLLTSSSLLKASDLWVPVTKKIKPQISTQYSLGTALNLGENYSLEIEAYYKDMDGLIEYKDGASFIVNSDNWEDKVSVGKGTSYGTEFFLQKKKGALTGWIGYTLSWTDRQFEDINFGDPFPYKYDRRHDISLVANYQLNPKWSFNSAWVFYSGNHVSFPTSTHINAQYQGRQDYGWLQFPSAESTVGNFYLGSPGVNENISGRNNFQLPAYHRLDISASRKKVNKKGRDTELIVGLTNAYNKLNPSFYYTQYGSVNNMGDVQNLDAKVYQVSLFPMLPTISYSLTF